MRNFGYKSNPGGRLLLAIVLIAGFPVATGVLGWFELLDVAANQARVVTQAIPAISEVRGVAEETSRVVAVAPELAAVTDEAQRVERAAFLFDQANALRARLLRQKGLPDDARANALAAEAGLRQALAAIDRLVRQRIEGASIADDAKRRILEAATALSLLARSLATNHTHQVAVFVDDFANPQKISYLDALIARLQANGLVALLININTSFDHVRALLNADQRQVDAVVLFGATFRDETLRDRRSGRGVPPTFVLARDSQIECVPAVDCNTELALTEIVDHLLATSRLQVGRQSPLDSARAPRPWT